MSVKVKKSALRGYLQKVLFEQFSDVPIGQAYQPFSGEGDDDDLTIHPDLPVAASEQMATQLTMERPPIEDDDYIPSSLVELGLAADVIGRMVPDDQIEYFYLRLKDLLDNTIERQNAPSATEATEEMEVEELETNEAFIKLFHKASPILSEQIKEMNDGNGMQDAEEDEEGTGLEDLATTFGYKAASGVRQDLERILKRLGYTAKNLSDAQLDTLQNFAASEFIDGLVINDYIDEDDAKELRRDPHRHVSNLDSFRFFFTSGFMLPAYQKIVRDARKRVEQEIDKLGTPQRTRQTILNQAFGDTPHSMSKLEKKLSRDAALENMDPDIVSDLMMQVRNVFPNLVKMASVEGDIVTGAMDIWHRAGAAKKSRVLNQALESTSAHQAQFGT